MEDPSKPLDKERTSLRISSNSSSKSNGSNSSSGNHVLLTPKTHGCPTTFIEADPGSFKRVVQILTGSPETVEQARKSTPSPSKSAIVQPIKTGPMKQAFNIHQRRNGVKKLKISSFVADFQKFCPTRLSQRKPNIMTPCMLKSHSHILSPVTTLTHDPFNGSTTTTPTYHDALAEERAISAKRFYLYPSPTTTPRRSVPQLLPLFPLISPRASGSSPGV